MREREKLERQQFACCLKYIFHLNHYNFARWLSLAVDDLLKLEYTCSEICIKNSVNEILPQSANQFFFYRYQSSP